MIDNAVTYYRSLRETGDKSHEDALAHAMQRFGVARDALEVRIAGRVANPDETRFALARIRERLVDDHDGYADADLLAMIYNAVTGESLTPRDEDCGTEYICGDCGEPRAPYSGTCSICLARKGGE